MLCACTSTPGTPVDAGSEETAVVVPCTPATLAGGTFASERDPSSMDVKLARAIADRYMSVHAAKDGTWNWTDAILMFSLLELHRVTGEASYREYVRAYIDARIAGGYIITKSDACPPAVNALALWRESCDAKYRTPVDDTLHYIYDVAPRTPEGALSHLGTFTAFGTTVWIDSLFMLGQFLVREGEWMNDKRALDTYAVQFHFDAQHLQDSSGFFMHAWNWPGEQTPGTHWARGNGWTLTSSADYLRVLGKRGEKDDETKASFLKLVDGIVKTQDPNTGLWFTIVDHPETYLETSGSALFALGLARAKRGGIVGMEVMPTITKAMTGVRSKIAMDMQGRPYVKDISAETDVGTFQDYATVPLKDDLHFGVGAVILALLETSGLT